MKKTGDHDGRLSSYFPVLIMNAGLEIVTVSGSMISVIVAVYVASYTFNPWLNV